MKDRSSRKWDFVFKSHNLTFCVVREVAKDKAIASKEQDGSESSKARVQR